MPLNQQDFLYDLAPAQAAVQHIEQANNWQDKYRQLMQLGKLLPQLAEEYRVESAQVKGCESQAWLYHLTIQDKHYFLADSDARIIKGLIGLLLVKLHDKTNADIQAFDGANYFASLGLSQQLSPSRTNGLTALLEAMQQQATS